MGLYLHVQMKSMSQLINLNIHTYVHAYKDKRKSIDIMRCIYLVRQLIEFLLPIFARKKIREQNILTLFLINS